MVVSEVDRGSACPQPALSDEPRDDRVIASDVHRSTSKNRGGDGLYRAVSVALSVRH